MLSVACEVCGVVAGVKVADLKEDPPFVAPDGSRYVRWSVAGVHFFCEEHQRPTRREYLPGTDPEEVARREAFYTDEKRLRIIEAIKQAYRGIPGGGPTRFKKVNSMRTVQLIGGPYAGPRELRDGTTAVRFIEGAEMHVYRVRPDGTFVYELTLTDALREEALVAPPAARPAPQGSFDPLLSEMDAAKPLRFREFL